MDHDSRKRRLNDLSVSRALREDAASSSADGQGAPDLCASILMRVDDQRAFLSGRDRRRVHVVRWSLGAILGVMTLASALAIRFAPEAVNLGPVPQPASRVIAAVQVEADKQAANLRDTLAVVSDVPTPRLSAVVAQVARGPSSTKANAMILTGAGGSGGIDVRSLAAAHARGDATPASTPSAGCFVGPFRSCGRSETNVEHGAAVSATPTLHAMAARLGCASNCRDFNAPAAANPAGTSWLTISNTASSTAMARERVLFVAPEVRFGSVTPLSPASPVMGDDSFMPK